MELFLCTHPRDVGSASKHPYPICHMAYRIGPEMQLYRNGLGVNVKGGMLSLSNIGFSWGAPYAATLIREVVWECANRGFTGLLCDFEGETTPVLREFVYDAADKLKKYGVTLYVPRAYAASAPGAHVLMSSAVTGGNCRERYQSDLQVYGAERSAFLVEPVTTDILLPGEEGGGKELTYEELQALMRREESIPYLSHELSACYFTYRDGEGRSHFVLFDDHRSILKKLQIAKETGFREAFILYPDAREILDEMAALREDGA
ncbi:hypothetical protein LJC34_02345 [Oscillospiraceae bacterium OttesenSCG-928-G22]|nr:hypothetical protein [Oscillospiraceae bacterium OttesenSCG-928-G22]